MQPAYPTGSPVWKRRVGSDSSTYFEGCIEDSGSLTDDMCVVRFLFSLELLKNKNTLSHASYGAQVAWSIIPHWGPHPRLGLCAADHRGQVPMTTGFFLFYTNISGSGAPPPQELESYWALEGEGVTNPLSLRVPRRFLLGEVLLRCGGQTDCFLF